MKEEERDGGRGGHKEEKEVEDGGEKEMEEEKEIRKREEVK